MGDRSSFLVQDTCRIPENLYVGWFQFPMAPNFKFGFALKEPPYPWQVDWLATGMLSRWGPCCRRPKQSHLKTGARWARSNIGGSDRLRHLKRTAVRIKLKLTQHWNRWLNQHLVFTCLGLHMGHGSAGYAEFLFPIHLDHADSITGADVGIWDKTFASDCGDRSWGPTCNNFTEFEREHLQENPVCLGKKSSPFEWLEVCGFPEDSNGDSFTRPVLLTWRTL